jgi:hypothetical protein
MNQIKLGILGMSEGNGHPYSWSAIFNGYEPSAMSECGFPGIPAYLSKQTFPQDCIHGARVTQVWTQDRSLSRHIAEATFIHSVSNEPEDMIGQVDAVLLARDDAENHRQFAEPFIAAGIPIYIDKPFALSRQDALNLFALETRPAQIFSCSALRFSREMLLTQQDIERIGGITRISAQVPKLWKKYAIHVIDPILQNCAPMENICNVRARSFGLDESGTEVSFDWHDGTKKCEIRALGSESSPILVEYSGPNGVLRTQFTDSFNAFKSALKIFINDSVRGNTSHAENIMNAIEILALGIAYPGNFKK